MVARVSQTASPSAAPEPSSSRRLRPGIVRRRTVLADQGTAGALPPPSVIATSACCGWAPARRASARGCRRSRRAGSCSNSPTRPGIWRSTASSARRRCCSSPSSAASSPTGGIGASCCSRRRSCRCRRRSRWRCSCSSARSTIWYILALSFVTGMRPGLRRSGLSVAHPFARQDRRSAERDRAQLDSVQHRPGHRAAPRGRGAPSIRHGVVLHAERHLVPGGHRLAAVTAREAHADRSRGAQDVRRVEGRPLVRAEREAPAGARRAGLRDDVPGPSRCSPSCRSSRRTCSRRAWARTAR